MTQVTHVLHDVHTATNDVLKGYREMVARAKPDIAPLVERLIRMHERHAADQAAILARDGDAEIGDTSLQGSLNKAVVIVRDWVSDLDRDALPAVRKGEESLLRQYAEAAGDDDLAARDGVSALLALQMRDIEREIAALPRD